MSGATSTKSFANHDALARARQWLQPTSYDDDAGEYRKHLASLHGGTGAWLTATPAYQSWLAGSAQNLLAITGVPGSGKSVLAAKVVHDLSRSSSPVLYFFFRQIIDANQEPVALLRDWISQLLPYSPGLQQTLHETVENGSHGDALGIVELWELLRKGVDGVEGYVYCVADALDEMNSGNAHFIKDLTGFASSKPEKVRILTTSRPVSSVTDALRSASRIRLDPNMVDKDISSFVKGRLECSELSLHDRALIHQAVPGRASGFFLYAKLALDAFLEPDADVQEVLAHLPADLNTIYDRLLTEHLRKSNLEPHVQILILQAATHTTRPLRLIELADMLRTAHPSLGSNLSGIKELIRYSSGPLLEILPNEVVSVIHHSFTEYLKGTTRLPEDNQYPILDAEQAHLCLSQICIKYLGRVLDDEWAETQQVPNSGAASLKDLAACITTLRLKYPFIDYSARSWAIHLGSTSLTTQRLMNENIHALFQKPLFRTMGVQIWWLNSKYYGQAQDSIRSSHYGHAIRWQDDGDSKAILHSSSHLHMAARLGLAGYAEYLASIGTVDVLDDSGKTPLYWASEHGQAEAVRVLIAAGADPDLPDTVRGLKPLHHAAKKNYSQVAAVLLEAGVNPLTRKTMEDPGLRCGNAISTEGAIAWMYACNGNLETMEAFLPYMTDTEMLNHGIYNAARYSHEGILARLLLHPDIDRSSKTLGSLLFSSCANRHLGIARTLLKAGADPNHRSFDNRAVSRFATTCRATYSCFEIVCKASPHIHMEDHPRTRCELIDLLIEYGADAHASDPALKGSTPLHLASDSPRVLRKLLALDFDPNKSNDDGDTPLHLVDDAEAVAILFGKGKAQLELRNTRDGRTPLLEMLRRAAGNEYPSIPIGSRGISAQRYSALKQLLDFEPDCLVIDMAGKTCLHYALGIRHSDEDALERRVKSGDDLKVAEYGSSRFAVDVISRLLEAGVDPNIADSSGQTCLDVVEESIPDQFGDILRLLQKAGLDIDAKNAAGRTFLFRLIGSKVLPSPAYVAQLLEMGASLDTRDSQGRTLLHEAMAAIYTGRGICETSPFRTLLDLGLDPLAVDHQGNTLLHEFAARTASRPRMIENHVMETTFDLLVGPLGIDINQANETGRAPLHELSGHCAHVDFECGDAPGSGAEKILAHSHDLNVQDRRGMAPLHLAVRSPTFTQILLRRGANPSIKTSQGLTPLHLAVRDGNADTVGMLLDALAGTMSKPGSWYFDASVKVPNVDDPDERTWTPLSYACRAGRPDLVELLIKAGANPDLRVNLEACSQFEDEIALWHAPRQKTRGMAEFSIEDPTRPECRDRRGGRDPIVCVHDTSRLDDVLDLLLGAGAGTIQQQQDLLDFVMKLESTTTKLYTRYCFTLAVVRNAASEGLGVEISPEFSQRMQQFCNEYRQMQREKVFGRGRPRYQSLFRDIMRSRCYDLVLDLEDMAGDLLTYDIDYMNENEAFHCLLKHGFAHLVSETLERRAQYPSEKRQKLRDSSVFSDPCSQFFAVIGTLHPNVHSLRLLVEYRRLDQEEVRKQSSKPPDIILQRLAEGKSWWHVALALPYLIRRGTNIECCMPKQQAAQAVAPLTFNLFRDDAQRLLAHTRATKLSDTTNQDHVTGSQHEAEPNSVAVLSAIRRELPHELERLLSQRPALANEPGNPTVARRNDRGEMETLRDSLSWYPLHYALDLYVLPGRSRAAEASELDAKRSTVIELLLKNGADPFAAYPASEVEFCADRSYKIMKDSGRRHQGTVLHQACLKRWHYVLQVLKHDIDVDRRDCKGRTILHMACVQAPDVGLLVDESPTLVEIILDRGADPLARDEAGCNVLHYALHNYTEHGLERPEQAKNEHLKTIKLLASRHPELVHQRNARGQTLVFLAMHRAANEKGATPAVEYLLSAGADPSLVDDEGNTLLHIAAEGLDLVEVFNLFQRLLTEHSPDINAKNKRGQTPLLVYARGETATARLTQEDQTMRYPWSTTRERVPVDDILRLFGEAGADWATTDGQGSGALHGAAHAVENGGIAKFEALRAKGLDPFMEDAEGRTALDIAVSCSNAPVLALFER